jgi:catechol 2,3-dioxygenase-like lactoylglutathione lyase family enzyme
MAILVPYFRVRDAEASVRWYERLGFEVTSWHQSEPGFPRLIAIEREGILIYLSEHDGDAPPESLAYLHVEDVESLAASLGLAVEDTDYQRREIEVVDLDGNRLRIGSPA